jgi:hypothetical protein
MGTEETAAARILKGIQNIILKFLLNFNTFRNFTTRFRIISNQNIKNRY